MTRVPIQGFNPMLNPRCTRNSPAPTSSMGETAENVARKWQVTREQQEQFAVESHRKAAAAQAAGRFKDEIVPIHDQGRQPWTRTAASAPTRTQEALAGLKPAFDKDGTVTAGTSSPLTDGAAAVLVCTEAYAERHGLTPLARIAGDRRRRLRTRASWASAPSRRRARRWSGPASPSDQLDIVELNEAFASQAIACARELGLRPRAAQPRTAARIALGHPLGATGARIIGKAASVLKRDGGKYALATQCIGGGQGIATVLEAV